MKYFYNVPQEPAYPLNVDQIRKLRNGRTYLDYSVYISDATRTFVSESTLWRIENIPGYNASLRDILAIAAAANTDINELINQPHLKD